MHIVNSAANHLIKEVVKLKKSHVRREKGLIIVDGLRETKIALDNNWELERLYLCPNLSAGEVLRGVDERLIVSVSEDSFKKICYKEKPDGVLGVFKAKLNKELDISPNDNPLLIVLEGVEKPGNIGAIIRTAAAAGVSGIIINDCQTDIYNPNVIRASQGEIFTQKIAIMSKDDTISWLKSAKIRCLAAATEGENSYFNEDLSGPVAIVLGSEDYGLSAEWRRAADKIIKIPMVGEIDSLNVSVAAAIIVFESRRQRINGDKKG